MTSRKLSPGMIQNREEFLGEISRASLRKEAVTAFPSESFHTFPLPCTLQPAMLSSSKEDQKKAKSPGKIRA